MAIVPMDETRAATTATTKKAKKKIERIRKRNGNVYENEVKRRRKKKLYIIRNCYIPAEWLR